VEDREGQAMADPIYVRIEKRKKRRKRRPRPGTPELSVPQILVWIDEHEARRGEWPTRKSGRIRGAPGETWDKIDQALRKGYRGLPGGDSLAALLVRLRGARRN